MSIEPPEPPEPPTREPPDSPGRPITPAGRSDRSPRKGVGILVLCAVVIVFGGLAYVMSLPMPLGDRSQRVATEVRLKSLVVAAESYHQVFERYPPLQDANSLKLLHEPLTTDTGRTHDALVTAPSDELNDAGQWVDAWGQTFQAEPNPSDAPPPGAGGRIISAGPDGQFGSDDDLSAAYGRAGQ